MDHPIGATLAGGLPCTRSPCNVYGMSSSTYFRPGDTVRIANLDSITERRTRNLLFIGSEANVVSARLNGSGEEIVMVKLVPSQAPFALYEWNIDLAD